MDKKTQNNGDLTSSLIEYEELTEPIRSFIRSELRNRTKKKGDMHLR